MNIDTSCSLSAFRRFMILSTCDTFIPPEFANDPDVFPERSSQYGTMYIEAEDKLTLQQIREIRFTRAQNILGIIYNSKSGRTQVKWRHVKGEMGRLTGPASPNSLVNLVLAGTLTHSYVQKVLGTSGEPVAQVPATASESQQVSPD